MKQLETSGAACLGQNRETAKPRNSVGDSFVNYHRFSSTSELSATALPGFWERLLFKTPPVCIVNQMALATNVKIDRLMKSHLSVNLLLLIGALCYLTCSPPVKGVSLIIEGHLEVWNILKTTNTLSYEEAFGVNIDVSNKLWRIDDLSEPPKTAFTYSNFVLDRENADSSIHLPQFSASSYCDGGYPIDLDQDQRTIWLVYCAGEFLRQHSGKPVILPDQDARSTIKIYGCVAKMAWSSQNSLCPSQIIFEFSTSAMKDFTKYLSYQSPGESLDYRQRQLTWYLGWVTNGTIRAQFEVSEWTNVFNMRIPVVWHIDYYQEGALTRVAQGRTKSITEGGIINCPVPNVIDLRDLRVLNVAKLNYVSYKVTNGVVPDLNNNNLTAKIARLDRHSYKQMPHDVSSRRTIIVFVLVMLLLMPVFSWLINHLYKRRHKNT